MVMLCPTLATCNRRGHQKKNFFFFYLYLNAFASPQGICFILLFQIEFKYQKKTKEKDPLYPIREMEKAGRSNTEYNNTPAYKNCPDGGTRKNSSHGIIPQQLEALSPEKGLKKKHFSFCFFSLGPPFFFSAPPPIFHFFLNHFFFTSKITKRTPKKKNCTQKNRYSFLLKKKKEAQVQI